MTLGEIETPALLLDLDALERNHARMMDFIAATRVQLRPHTKTHRTPALAHYQLRHGAAGICCGNLGEAEVMIAAGIRDVLVTKEIVQLSEIARVAQLARASEIIVVVDDARVVEQFARAAQTAGVEIRVLVQVDVRLGRAGTAPGRAALELARAVHRAPGLRFTGLLGYEGSMHNLAPDERAEQCRAALDKLVQTKRLIEDDGIPVAIASAGATTTYRTAAAVEGITEVQPGSYLTGDARYLADWSPFECALSVLTTVISRPSATRVTTDVGQKKISQDAGLPLVKNGNGWNCIALNEEHCLLARTEYAPDVCIGDRLELIPFHGGTTINLYDRMYGTRRDSIETIFEIAGQGK